LRRARKALVEARAKAEKAVAKTAEELAEVRVQPGWQFVQVLSLFTKLVEVRAGHVAKAAAGDWATQLCVMRKLSGDLVPV
jgi:hypothetical protein